MPQPGCVCIPRHPLRFPWKGNPVSARAGGAKSAPMKERTIENSRLVAVRILGDLLIRGHPPDRALARTSGRDRALVMELVYGVSRWYLRLRAVADSCIDRPLKPRHADVLHLILVGLYQLLYTRIPAHAAINETVAVAAGLRKSWASGLVNAVLRSVHRAPERFQAQADAEPASRYAHPPWLLDRLRIAYPSNYREILEANQQRPPMFVRVNQRRTTVDKYRAQLARLGIPARTHRLAAHALELPEPVDVADLPGFDAGEVSVQDAAAQLAAPLLDCRPGMRVLDACAAPGGKTGHILETACDVEVVAVDHSAVRLARIRENLGRLDLEAQLLEADVMEPGRWYDGYPYDRILLDAPCSATGVIRRHPDIKWLRQPCDMQPLVEVQGRMLEALWPLLRPGGMMLYATCSVLPEENSDLIRRFRERHMDCEMVAYPGPVAKTERGEWQILTGSHGMDGFFFARLAKHGERDAADAS